MESKNDDDDVGCGDVGRSWLIFMAGGNVQCCVNPSPCSVGLCVWSLSSKLLYDVTGNYLKL